MVVLPQRSARTYHSAAGRSTNHRPGDWLAAWVGLGANLGDARTTLRRAVERLGRLPGCERTGLSECRVTAPVGPPQPAYLNAVVRLRVRISPRALLAALQQLEQAAGRARDVRWGPRTLDLDLLMFGDRTLTSEALTLPHPRLHERRFVLEPMCDLDPGLRHPLLDRTVAELLDELA